MSDDWNDLFSDGGNRGHQRMTMLLNDPTVSQITCNGHDRISFDDAGGRKQVEATFSGREQYVAWVNDLMKLTDVGHTDVDNANTSVIEGSFRPDRTPVQGSIHICTREITRGEPALTVRKQPKDLVTLVTMLGQGMMSPDMATFLEQAIRGRSNILVSGGSGAGKTTLARALSQYIDPNQRVITVEEIDELHLADRLPNIVALTAFRKRDVDGRVQRDTTLADLVREALRMRGDRVWVGETRGAEAYALVKACNSGHDGSVTTMHADSGRQAVSQVTTYVMESGLTEEPARDQVTQAFDLVVQISKIRQGVRAITEITEIEKVREGNVQRLVKLYGYDPDTNTFRQHARPTNALLYQWSKNSVNYDGIPGRL